MNVEILSFENLHIHGGLFVSFLKARKQAFIVQNNWNLPEAQGMEYDQYDTPASRWVVVHEDGKVLAGIRLTPTTAVCGIYTYMIRDAQRGLIDSVPSNLLYFEAPVDPNIWESSRIFVMQDVPAKKRTRVQSLLMNGLIKAARAENARIVLGLVPAVWSRWIKRLGLQAEPAGPVLDLDGWQTQVAMMTLEPDVDRVAPRPAARKRLPPLAAPAKQEARPPSIAAKFRQLMRIAPTPSRAPVLRKSLGL